MQQQRRFAERIILYGLLSSFLAGLLAILSNLLLGKSDWLMRLGAVSVPSCQTPDWLMHPAPSLLADLLVNLLATLFSGQILLLPARSGGLGQILVLLLPLGLVWGRQRQLLRLSPEALATAWFGYRRLLSGLSLGIWVAWIGLLGLSGPDQRSLLAEAQAVLLLLLPPVLAIACCYGLSYRLLNRISPNGCTRIALIRQTSWSQFCGMLPLALFLSGCRLFFYHHLPEAMLLFGATYFSQVGLSYTNPTSPEKPQALTTGELRDRIFALAQPTGVQLQQVYILPARGRTANAFAIQSGSLLLTEQLLQHLNRRELDAIVAHELAHLQGKHPQILQLILLLALAGILGSQSLLGQFGAGWLGADWFGAGWFAAVGLGAMLLPAYFACLRRFEYAADARAAQITQDPMAMITSLVKLAQLSRTPWDWGKYTGPFMAHPSLRQRVQAVGQRYGLSGWQVQSLLESRTGCETDWHPGHYRLPDALSQTPLLFSTSLKQQMALGLEWRLVLALILPLAAMAWIQPLADSLVAVCLYGWGWLLALGLARLTRCVPQGYAVLRQKLTQKLRQQQLNPQVWDGTFVGLAPDAAPRCYEGLPFWDLGFLFLVGDRLCYVGEQACFALDSTQITQIVQDQPTASLVIRWHDGCESGSFRLYCPCTDWQQPSGRIQMLGQRLGQWQLRPPQEQTGLEVDPFVTLMSPRFGTVTSETVGSYRLKQLGSGLIKLLAVGLAICIVLQQPTVQSSNGLSDGQIYGLVYVLGGSVVGFLLQFLPQWSQQNLRARTIQKFRYG